MIRPLRVAGLDFSLNGTGIAVTHDSVGEPRLSCRTVTPRKYPSANLIDHRRMKETADAVIAAVQFRPDLVAIESPLLVDGTGDSSLRTAELHGAIKHYLWAHGVPYVDVNPQHVKTYATGKGNAKKADVLEAVIARYGRLVHVGDHNAADALTLLGLTLDHYGQPLAPVDAHRGRAVTAVTWPKLDLQEGGLK
jgi:crossover junction endodeoxyribonuclease RuvC